VTLKELVPLIACDAGLKTEASAQVKGIGVQYPPFRYWSADDNYPIDKVAGIEALFKIGESTHEAVGYCIAVCGPDSLANIILAGVSESRCSDYSPLCTRVPEENRPVHQVVVHV
jgi:hypothetical protein